MFAKATTGGPARLPLIFAAVLLAAQFLVIGLLFKHGIDFHCLDFWPAAACGGASRALAGLYCAIAALGLLALLRPQQFRDLLAAPGSDPRALLLNLAGFAITLLPALFLRESGDARQMMLPAFACWGVGMALLLAGLLGWLANRDRWMRFLRAVGPALPVAIITGALAPVLAMRLQPLWQLDTIADTTFRMVDWLVGQLGYDLYSDPVTKIIGTDEFRISVAPVCSGIEGIALVTLFVTLYLWLFRAETRFPRALILYPLGIAASIALNIVRISALLILGIEGQPELAVGGFHSHAGWIMFTLVALGVIAVARNMVWLRKTPADAAPRSALPPISRDPQAARILPFAVFMLTAVLVPAISQSPAVLYPARMLLLAAVVALFWPIYRRIDARISPMALVAGAVVGIVWALIPVAPASQPPYGDLAGAALIGWYLFRGLGTILLVPLVEELFFRDYLESRIRGAAPDQPAPMWRVVLAALVTAALFAALHDRWAEAFAAGLAFSLVARRSGRIADAVAAHAVANAVVFAAAVLTGNLAII